MKSSHPTCVCTDRLVEIWNRFIFKAPGIYSALRHLLKLTGRLAGHLKGDRVKKSATIFRSRPEPAAHDGTGSRRNRRKLRQVTYRVHRGASLEALGSNDTDYTCKRCTLVDVCLSSSLLTRRHLSRVTGNFNKVRTQN